MVYDTPKDGKLMTQRVEWIEIVTNWGFDYLQMDIQNSSTISYNFQHYMFSVVKNTWCFWSKQSASAALGCGRQKKEHSGQY